MMKRVTFIRGNVLQVPRVAGVCQFIEIKYRRSFLRNPLQDEIRSDKPGATGDHNCVIHVRRACHSGRLFDCNKKSGNSIARLIKASKWTPPLQHGLRLSGMSLARVQIPAPIASSSAKESPSRSEGSTKSVALVRRSFNASPATQSTNRILSLS